MKKIVLVLLFLFSILAFIFFIKKTEILEDKGILVELPPYDSVIDLLDSKAEFNPRNVLKILVNIEGVAIIKKEEIAVDKIRDLVKNFIINPEQDIELAESPKDAIISLSNERNAPYEKYLEIYNEIKAAYNDLWDLESRKLFKKNYEGLPYGQKKIVRAIIPFVLSESEPTDF